MKSLLKLIVLAAILISCQEDPISRGTGDPLDPSNQIKAILSNDNDDTYVVVSKKADEDFFNEGVIISAGDTDELQLSACCSHVIRAYIKNDLVNHKYEWYVNLRSDDIYIQF